MPARRSTGGNAVAGPSAQVALPPVEVHPITKRLRRMWKFAAVCQFLFAFDEAFGMSGFETELLESDFEGSQTEIIPDLMRRLLYTLTLDRTIDTTNWQQHVQRQYLARDPDANKFGTLEDPVQWHDLSLEDRISTIHDLCEWQFQDAERFRKLVKSDDETNNWRVLPIGWDSHDNAYWLFDDNRIWIQRPEPVVQPARAPAKAKGAAKKGTKRAKAEAAAAKRAAAQKRAAVSAQPARRATRNSGRFESAATTNGSASGGLFDDSDSELSDLPDDMVNTSATDVEMPDVKSPAVEPVEAEAETSAKSEESSWIEFEAIVVTRQEWLDFSKQFSKSKDPNEKALHHYIKDEVLDTVLAAMDEVDKQKALEAALANRKRSSRIAIKESEKEERERDRAARVRMEEKMNSIRLEEEQARKRAEEEEQALVARENRIREREDRMRARELELENKAIREEEERERREQRARRREEIIANGGVPPPSRESTAVPDEPMPDSAAAPDPAVKAEREDDWELNCEICGKHAVNPPNESTQIVCCEQCGIWQHVRCWNKFDKHILHLPKNRKWASVDFYCTKCRPPAEGVPRPTPPMVFKREKASPSAVSNGRPSQDLDSPIAQSMHSPTPHQMGHRIVLDLPHYQPFAGERYAPINSMAPNVASQNPAAQHVVGTQSAETGQLASFAPTNTAANALPLRAPPSSFSIPAGNGVSTAYVPIASATYPPGPFAPIAPLHGSQGMQPPQMGRSLEVPSPKAADAGPTSLGLGRPTQAPQVSQMGSPRSPGSGLSPLPSSGRSPSYGGMGSPAYRRPSQVSGSFPMRHTPMRSPLSRAHDSPMENGGDGFSLGPPRAVSPSLQRAQVPSFGQVTASQETRVPTLPPTPMRHVQVEHTPAGARAAVMSFSAAGAALSHPESESQNNSAQATSASEPFTSGSPKQSEASNVAQMLDKGISTVPHLFSDPTHQHVGATRPPSPPLLLPKKQEDKPIELAPTHITSPTPPQDRTQ